MDIKNITELVAQRNDISLDQKFRQKADEGDLSLIKQFALDQEITTEDVHVRAMYLCNDLVDYYFTRFDEADLDAIAEMLPGQSVIVGHKREMAPIARFYKAEKVVRTDKKFINEETGEDVRWIKAYFYWPTGVEGSEDMRKKIDTGVWKEISISWSYKRCVCSICGKDMLQGMAALFADEDEDVCKHRLGKQYEGKLCYGTVKDITKVLEGSVVFKGGQKFTELAFVRSADGQEVNIEDADPEVRDLANGTMEFYKQRILGANPDGEPAKNEFRHMARALEEAKVSSPVWYNKEMKRFFCAESDRDIVSSIVEGARFVEGVSETQDFMRGESEGIVSCLAAPVDKQPGIYFKPTKPHRRYDESNEYYKADRLRELVGSYMLSPKYDGIRLTVHKSENGEIRMFTMGGMEVARKFPAIVEQVRGFDPKTLILDGELVRINKNKRTTHADVSSYINNPNSDIDHRTFTFKAFDMVYLNGEDVSEKPLSERVHLLNSNIQTTANVNRVANMTAQSGEEVVSMIDQVSSREGAVIKKSDAAYAEARTWYKWKRQAEFTARVSKVNKVDSSRFTYNISVLDEKDNLVEVGRTYQTGVEAEEGDNIRMSVAYIKKNEDGSLMISEPNVVCKMFESIEPDSMITIERIMEEYDEDRQGKMKKCPKCGISVAADAKVCPKCGYKFTEDTGKTDKKTDEPKEESDDSKSIVDDPNKTTYRIEHHWDSAEQFRILEINKEGRYFNVVIQGGINDDLSKRSMKRVDLHVDLSIDDNRKIKTKERQDLPDRAFALVYMKDGQKVRKLPLHNSKVSSGHTWTGEDVERAQVSSAAQLISKIKDAPDAKIRMAKKHIDKHLEALNEEGIETKKREICNGEAKVEVLTTGEIRVELINTKRSGITERFLLQPVRINGKIDYYYKAIQS